MALCGRLLANAAPNEILNLLFYSHLLDLANCCQVFPAPKQEHGYLIVSR
jgi:hypothetical protein